MLPVTGRQRRAQAAYVLYSSLQSRETEPCNRHGPYPPTYSARRHHGLARAFAVDHDPEGIRCNAGWIDGPERGLGQRHAGPEQLIANRQNDFRESFHYIVSPSWEVRSQLSRLQFLLSQLECTVLMEDVK
jgi:hypothetical protein